MSLLQSIRREILWHFVIRTLNLLFTVCGRVRVIYTDARPPRTGFILASNHVSHFDPPVITAFFPRKIDWIAVVELFHGRLLHAFFTGLNVIPVDRGGADRTALRTAVKRLQEGRVVGIFPEGGIRDGAASIVNGARMKPGLALLSVLSGAPVLPCVILGSDRFYNRGRWLPWKRTPVWVAYGRLITPPADLSGEDKRARIQAEFAAEILRLKDVLLREHGVTDSDLPHSPRERMAGR